MRNKSGSAAAVVIAIIVLVVLNRAAQESAPDPTLRAQKLAAAQDAHNMISAQALGREPDPLVTDATYGDVGTASLRATIGFTANSFLAVHPSEEVQMANTLKQWTQTFDFASAHIVCLDVPPGMRRYSAQDVVLGLSLNGSPVPGMSDDITPKGLTPDKVHRYIYSLSWPLKTHEMNVYFRKIYGSKPSPGYHQ